MKLLKNKKILFLLYTFLAIVICLSPSVVWAKYTSSLNAGNFNLSIAPIERVYMVYSEDDNSFEIFKGLDIPEEGGTSRTNKTVTKVYHDHIETTKYTLKLSNGSISSDSIIPSWHEISSKIEKVTIIDKVSPISTSGWFYGFSKVTSFDLTNLDTSNVEDMSAMFRGCKAITSIDLSGLDTSKNTRTSTMFMECSKLTDINWGEFDTSNVGSMGDMFSGCSSLTSIDLSGLNTESATYMGWMFTNCTKLKNINLTNLITDNVTGMDGMFWVCPAITELDLTSFNTSNVTTMDSMFRGCSNLKTIYASENFVTTKVTKSTNMFYSCGNLEGGYGTTISTTGGSIDKTYARIDKVEEIGYFTEKSIVVTNEEELASAKDTEKDYTVNGGTYSTSITAAGVMVTVDGNATVECNYPLSISNGGSMVVNDATIIGSETVPPTIKVYSASSLIINGGTFSGWVLLMGDSDCSVKIYDGIFNVEVLNGYGGWDVSKVGNIEIYGGTFKCDPSTYVADGYEAIKTADGMYTVQIKAD